MAALFRADRSDGRIVGDEGPLLHYANNILHGHYVTEGTLNGVQYLWHGPGLPLLLAPMVWLGVPLGAMRLVTGPLLLFVAIVAFWRLLLLCLPPRAALLGSYAFGLYLPFGYLMGSLTKEELALALVILAMHCVTRSLRNGERRYTFLGGAALGALVYVRIEYGWVLVATLVAAGAWTLRRRQNPAPRRFVAVCAVALACCAPWLAYTQHVTGRTFYWGNSGGLSLYWMSSPSSSQLGEWHAEHTVFRDPGLVAYRPFFRRIGDLPPLQQDAALQHTAVAQIRAHPGKYALNIAANATRMLFAAPLGVDLGTPLFILYVLCNTLLIGALIRTLTAFRRSCSWPPETPAVALLALFGFAVHLPPSADPRMFMPLVPLLLWLTAQRWAVPDYGRPRPVHLPGSACRS